MDVDVGIALTIFVDVRGCHLCDLMSIGGCVWVKVASYVEAMYIDTGGRGDITQGVSFEFFESFLLIYSHNTHWVNFEFFQKLLTTLIKIYSLGNF